PRREVRVHDSAASPGGYEAAPRVSTGRSAERAVTTPSHKKVEKSGSRRTGAALIGLIRPIG
ncbi:hypothetical protein, partial [Paramuribaculum intestinale]|uniref:hypothetical protein n=1 Tax=Paramuribaculum intestinale TaxID=2094151 RepID=UPI0025AF62FB